MQIGPYQLENPLALAPMAGVTDLPFRQLCRQLGAGYVVSEMIHSNPRLRATRKSRLRSCHEGEAEPVAIQIAGSEPEMMAEAAVYNVQQGAQIIDINMGCPAKKVCNKAAGSALLEHEDLVASILRAVVEAVRVPVTLKIRTGPEPGRRNGLRIAQIAEDSGVAALAVHGRTRAERFKGTAEYRTIREICRQVKIPVFANGDIDTPQAAARVLDFTGATGLMIGRGAQGNPWIFRELQHFLTTGKVLDPPAAREVGATMCSHLRQLHAHYGDQQGVRIARKHLGWYLAGRPGGEKMRQRLMRAENAEQQLHLIEQYFDNLDQLAA